MTLTRDAACILKIPDDTGESIRKNAEAVNGIDCVLIAVYNNLYINYTTTYVLAQHADIEKWKYCSF